MKTFKQFINEVINSTEIGGHPMIEIDGKMKHVNNSLGQPIHPTEDGIRNFHKWFGNSKIVDQHGRPQVMYHGTSSDVPKFDLSFAVKGNDANGPGFYLTPDREVASQYAGISTKYQYTGNAQHAQNIIPTYVSMKKPLEKESENSLTLRQVYALIQAAPNYEETLGDYWGQIKNRRDFDRVLSYAAHTHVDSPLFRQLIHMQGDFYRDYPEDLLKNFKRITKYDGVIDGDGVVTVFTPNQIKSAIGNIGKFSKRKDELIEWENSI